MADANEGKAQKTDDAKAKKPAKKEKPPKVEDKPFGEFVEQHYLPALKDDLSDRGVSDLHLSFVKAPIDMPGLGGEDCWQVRGVWNGGDRQFSVYFLKEDISSNKAFSCTEKGAPAGTLEPFLIDERRMSLDLLVSGVALRLRAQKWIERN